MWVLFLGIFVLFATVILLYLLTNVQLLIIINKESSMRVKWLWFEKERPLRDLNYPEMPSHLDTLREDSEKFVSFYKNVFGDTVALFKVVNGKISMSVHRFNVTVGTGDAASTGILYGVMLNAGNAAIDYMNYKYDGKFEMVNQPVLTPDFNQKRRDFDGEFTFIIPLRKIKKAWPIVKKYF